MYDFTTLWINRSDVAAFVAIALKAGVGKVGEFRLAAMLFSDDMVNFVTIKIQSLVIRLLAVLALFPSTLDHGNAQFA